MKNYNFLKLITIVILMFPIEFICIYLNYHSHSIISYSLLVIELIVISYLLYIFKPYKSFDIIIAKMIGSCLSIIAVYHFMNIKLSAMYFKPLAADSLIILLSILNFFFIIFLYVIIKALNEK